MTVCCDDFDTKPHANKPLGGLLFILKLDLLVPVCETPPSAAQHYPCAWAVAELITHHLHLCELVSKYAR